MKMEDIVNDLMATLGLDNLQTMLGIPDDEQVIHLPAAQLLTAVEKLLELGVWHLSAITCLQEKCFILLYHFWCFGNLTLRVEVAEGTPCIRSVSALIPGAEYYEREIREMYGIEFEGLTNPSSLFLPDNWHAGYPMRTTDEQNAVAGENERKNGMQGGTS
ncbi:MAG TPA: NADH-quinone oxidoreductase subunit C [Anaerolineaceae bacterium]|jgi:Ni,Fe-hydrogenase III component G|nr:NADH-quinone oxidoreductase subunit C [Anaerolineaceae bacterium]